VTASKIPHWRVLLVDDEEDVRDTLAMGLRKNGFYVAEFNNAISALSIVEPGLFDLAILDVRMPKLSGFELYMKIREKDRRVNVCFLTAFEAFDEFRNLFPELATRHFVRKPIMITSLVKRLNLILNNIEA